jgi:ribosome-associated heat shock protein Hsp15
MPGVRLDVWLDVACLYRTRSEAKRACDAGRVTVNGDRARAHRLLREGDRLAFSRGAGHVQTVIVRLLLDRHVKKAEARALYDDVTPRPSPEEIERRRAERAYRAAAAAAGRPDRRRRREIIRHKETR